MRPLTERLLEPLDLKRCTLPTRILRSATYEGMADSTGSPLPALTKCYCDIVRDVPGTIITGFCAVSKAGRAMHPAQGALFDDALIQPWSRLTRAVHDVSPQTRLFMQLAHTGRQTLAKITGQPVLGVNGKRCSYFRQKPRPMTPGEAQEAVQEFACAAARAQEAGFDGVQVHAAHGYLIHQFLSPHTNTRVDEYQDRALFLERTIEGIRTSCGLDFPLLLKVSHSDDRGLALADVRAAVRRVEHQLDAVEVSYGTMEWALNIIRGACPIDALLAVNPLFSSIPAPLKALWKRFIYPRKRREFIPYSRCYNVQGALELQKGLSVPMIPVGGIHDTEDMERCLDAGFPAISLCRPFIAEPDLLAKVAQGSWHSTCTVCNRCTIHCDAPTSLRCYRAQNESS